MGIYEDRQIHTKTGFRPIKLQESQSGPHTNRTPSNNSEYSLPSMVPYMKVKFQVIVFGYRAEIDNSELSLPSNSMCHRKFRLIVFALYIKATTRISPEFSELSLWLDTLPFDIWGIPPRLKSFTLDTKVPNSAKRFGLKNAG